jgi:hypothetical protein
MGLAFNDGGKFLKNEYLEDQKDDGKITLRWISGR